MQASAQAPVNHVSTDDEDLDRRDAGGRRSLSRRHSERRQSSTKTQAALTERNIGAQPVVDDQPSSQNRRRPVAEGAQVPEGGDTSPGIDRNNRCRGAAGRTSCEVAPTRTRVTSNSPSSRNSSWSTWGQVWMTKTNLIGAGIGLRTYAAQNSHPSASDADDQGGLSAEP